MGFVVLANPSPPGITDDDVPPVHNCCEDFAPPDGQPFPEGSPEEEKYEGCKANPAAYCTIPINNSRYIYISIVAGVALASFVIARRMKT